MINVGDTVITTKGCRIAGAGGQLEVLDTDRMWGGFLAVLCRKADGTTRTYLLKNLVKVKGEDK